MARMHGFNKRAPRVDLRHPAIMTNSDGTASSVTILDISNGGFRLEVPELPRIGEFVTLRVDRGDVFDAQIRWALGDEAGGVFLSPVDHIDWTPAVGEERDTMADEDGKQTGERRGGMERRQDERRFGADRRQGGRKSDRRERERRQGERRS